MLTQMDPLAQVKTYLPRVDRDRGNILGALQHSLDTPDLLPQGHRLALCLHTYWSHRGLRAEGRTWHRRFLQTGRGQLSQAEKAASLLKIFDYSVGLGEGDSVTAQQCLQEALAIYQAEGDRKGESDIYLALGNRQSYTDQHAEAYDNFQKAFDYYRDAGPPHTRIFLLIMLGGCQSNLQRHAEADATHRQALALARTHNSPTMEGLALLFRAFNARKRNLLKLAERHFLQSLEVYESIPSPWGIVRAQTALADIKRRQGDFDRSHELFRASLQHRPLHRSPGDYLHSSRHLATAARSTGLGSESGSLGGFAASERALSRSCRYISGEDAECSHYSSRASRPAGGGSDPPGGWLR